MNDAILWNVAKILILWIIVAIALVGKILAKRHVLIGVVMGVVAATATVVALMVMIIWVLLVVLGKANAALRVNRRMVIIHHWLAQSEEGNDARHQDGQ